MSSVCRTSLNERKKYQVVLFIHFFSCNFLSVLSFLITTQSSLVFSFTLCVTATSCTTGRRLLSLLKLDTGRCCCSGSWRRALGNDSRVEVNECRIVCVCGSAGVIDTSAAPRLIGSHGGRFNRHLGADP